MSAPAAAAVAGLAVYSMYRTLGARADPAATKQEVGDALSGKPLGPPTKRGIVFLTGDTPLAEPTLAPSALDKQSAFAYNPLPPVRSNWQAVRTPKDQRQAIENLW